MTEPEAALDRIAGRMKLYLTAAVLFVSAATAVGTYAVANVTSGIHAEIADTRGDLAQLVTAQQARGALDSTRFERVMDIVELAVVAIVEPDGSAEQKRAVAELRRRRHFTP